MDAHIELCDEDRVTVEQASARRDFKKTMGKRYRKLLPPGYTMEEVKLSSIGAEVAAARLFCCGWHDSLGRDGQRGDLEAPFPFEVRWTPFRNYHLVVHDYDNPKKIVVLMQGKYPRYTARGWIRAGEVMEHGEWWFEGMDFPGYRVPHDALRPNEELLVRVLEAWYT